MNAYLSFIGLNKEQSQHLAEKLNHLLADYQMFYMNARGFHWNIRGEKFFELHVKFEELYTDLLVKIDEIAERILTLGSLPIHAFTDYVALANVREEKGVSDGKEAVNSVLNAFQIVISKQRELLQLAGEANDEGTNALMSDYIREQEKSVWMYSAYLNK